MHPINILVIIGLHSHYQYTRASRYIVIQLKWWLIPFILRQKVIDYIQNCIDMVLEFTTNMVSTNRHSIIYIINANNKHMFILRNLPFVLKLFSWLLQYDTSPLSRFTFSSAHFLSQLYTHMIPESYTFSGSHIYVDFLCVLCVLFPLLVNKHLSFRLFFIILVYKSIYYLFFIYVHATASLSVKYCVLFLFIRFRYNMFTITYVYIHLYEQLPSL